MFSTVLFYLWVGKRAEHDQLHFRGCDVSNQWLRGIALRAAPHGRRARPGWGLGRAGAEARAQAAPGRGRGGVPAWVPGARHVDVHHVSSLDCPYFQLTNCSDDQNEDLWI